MTHRIDRRNDGAAVVLAFQGVLDRAALSDVRVHCAPLVLCGAQVRLVLSAGTEVEAGCLDELAGLEGVEVVAEAPFLRRWLARRRTERRRARRS